MRKEQADKSRNPQSFEEEVVPLLVLCCMTNSSLSTVHRFRLQLSNYDVKEANLKVQYLIAQVIVLCTQSRLKVKGRLIKILVI